jgi:hypothetical protein
MTVTVEALLSELSKWKIINALVLVQNNINSCNTMFPRDMACLRNTSVDTLHKGDTEDNNNNNKRQFEDKFMVSIPMKL